MADALWFAAALGSVWMLLAFAAAGLVALAEAGIKRKERTLARQQQRRIESLLQCTLCTRDGIDPEIMHAGALEQLGHNRKEPRHA